MKNFIAVASCPSSGSTLVADLLDSLPNFVCGPETSLLAVVSQLSLKSNALDKSLISYDSCKTTLSIGINRLHEYGLTANILKKLWAESETKDCFLGHISKRYSVFRGKPLDSYFCEKTPTNFAYSLDIAKISSVFGMIFVIRDPLFTVTSMVKRGYSLREASSAWLQAATIAYNMIRSGQENVAIIRYEDLVLNPFQAILTALNEMKCTLPEISIKSFEHLYESNLYRKIVSPKSIETWNVTNYGSISNANLYISESVLKYLQNSRGLRLNNKVKFYSDLQEFPSLSELCEYFDYSFNVSASLDSMVCHKGIQDNLRWFKCLLVYVDCIRRNPSYSLKVLRDRSKRICSF